jgi:hypothetical protein
MKTNVYTVPYFINLTKVIGRENVAWIVHDAMLKGLAKNPNLNQEDFIHLLTLVPHENWQLMGRYIRNHMNEKELQFWWNYTITNKSPEEMNFGFYIYRAIFDFYKNPNPMKENIINYYLNLKETTIKDAQGRIIPNYHYRFFLEFMIENETDMNRYDYFLSLYREGKEKFKMYDDMILWKFSENKYLDEQRIRALYLASQNFHEESKINVITRLMQCKNISVELLDEFLGLRKTIKIKRLISDLYMGAASNPTHIHHVFDVLYKYIQKGMKSTSFRHQVFRELFTNPELNDSELNSLIEILENKEVSMDVYMMYGYAQLTGIIQAALNRNNLTTDTIDRLLNIYLPFLKRVESFREQQGPFFGQGPPDVFSKVQLNEAQLDRILNTISGNIFEYPILGNLVGNVNINKEQYILLTTMLENNYYINGKFMPIDVNPQSDPKQTHYVMENWVSSKFVAY